MCPLCLPTEGCKRTQVLARSRSSTSTLRGPKIARDLGQADARVGPCGLVGAARLVQVEEEKRLPLPRDPPSLRVLLAPATTSDTLHRAHANAQTPKNANYHAPTLSTDALT